MKLSKVYEPSKFEADIYALWEKSRAFTPKNRGSNASYSIVVPPPNANGNLHLGHVLTLALEDVATRYHRLKGEAALLLPGADHAGFETQVVYEKQLSKEGKSRFDFTREELYKQIWDFVAQNKDDYESQFRKLGASVDWNRYVFTLDKKIVENAYKTFKKMWDEGLIYRGERLVNFCTFHGTAFADIEVEYKQEHGHLWHIRYPLTDSSGEIVVATTRPETMLGDTAVAVHPEDKKHAKFIGKTVRLPLANREIPVIADEMVDTAFGTGAVKITPAHDPNDFEVAQRHGLPKISVIDFEGKISLEAPEKYQGLSVKEARKAVIEDLKEQGLLAKTNRLKHSVGHCYKCGTVIQPLLKDQWFVDMKPLAKSAIAALKANKIKFYPAVKRTQLISYLEGLKDWNISRQIAWGIPIPAFQNIDNPDDWVYDERVDEEELKIDGKTYRRDPDVFDTWFSSSSWPYATLDFPGGDDFKKFYPLSVMETGGEILYPWVSRMIMLGLYVTKKVPFEAVYIHGYVMAEDGSKMSKSVGNVIDPMPVIEEYGSDALRMGIIAGRVPAVNRGYDSRRVEEARNFANKLWNIARYIEGRLGDDYKRVQPKPERLADYWILTKLQHLTGAVSADLDSYRFAEAYEKLYHFVWDDLADWYIEASKKSLNPSVLACVLEATLICLHPFAPFVTETIWQTLKWEQGSILAVRPWPKIEASDSKQAKVFETTREVIVELRYLSNELGIKNPVFYYDAKDFSEEQIALIESLAKLKDTRTGQPESGLQLTHNASCWIEASKEQRKEYEDNLLAKIEVAKDQIDTLEERLSNKSYVKNAPKKLVEESQSQLGETKTLLERLKEEEKHLKTS